MTANGHVFGHYYDVLTPYLSQEGVTDLFINHADSIYLVTLKQGVQRIHDSRIDDRFIKGFSRIVASQNEKSYRLPIISTSFEAGERIEMLQPDAVKQSCFAIRKPTEHLFSLDELSAQGVFAEAAINPERQDVTEVLSKNFKKNAGDIDQLLKRAVTEKLNIVISGATGSAKTTLSKALIDYIPADERLITIEDSEELTTPKHHNALHLFFPREHVETESLITANNLLVSCLRLKPDRILLSELRGDEAFDFLDSVNTGHPGAITTLHATSHHGAVDRLVQMIRRNPAAQGLSIDDIKNSVFNQVDLFLHMENRRLKTVYFPRAAV